MKPPPGEIGIRCGTAARCVRSGVENGARGPESLMLRGGPTGPPRREAVYNVSVDPRSEEGASAPPSDEVRSTPPAEAAYCSSFSALVKRPACERSALARVSNQ